MGKKSRDKGKRGELMFAKLCQEHGYDAYRTAQHRGKNGGEPDVQGLPHLHVEVKNAKRHQPYEHMAQAKRDAKAGLLPIVAMKRDYHGWLIVMEPDTFFEIYREYEAGRNVADVAAMMKEGRIIGEICSSDAAIAIKKGRL